jgi:hypothetical protein
MFITHAWDPSIPDDIAVRIGRFMAATSMMDFAMDSVIWHLLGVKPADARPLTFRLESGKKVDAIENLIKRRQRSLTAEQLAAWTTAKECINEVSKERNWVAHGVWIKVWLGAFRTHKGTVGTYKPISQDDLDRWIERATEAIRELTKLLPSGPTPSPGTP